MQGTVLRAQSGFFWVQTDAGLLECTLRGRLKKERQSSDIAVIGDLVDVKQVSPNTGAIESVEPRRTKLARRAAGTKGIWSEDVLIANLDQVLLVFACASPDFHPRMLDRYLALTESSELETVIVANKIDLVGLERARELFGEYERIGYPVHYVSAREGIGVEALADRLAGRTSVVTGPSGVGKSTLLNAIQPGLRIETGDVSEVLHKGRHTTTTAELHPLSGPDSGFVADTPGLRELGLWQVPPNELAWAFPEFEPFLGGCNFNDCRHLEEPRCAIRAAVAGGDISEARYDSYRRLLLNED